MINRNDDNNELKTMVMLCITAASCVLLIFLGFLYLNDSNDKKIKASVESENVESEADEIYVEAGKKNFVSKDLDFWDMYEELEAIEEDDEDLESGVETKESIKKYKNKTSDTDDEDKNDEIDENQADNSMNYDSDDEKDNEDLNDGKHIKVDNGLDSVVWHEILEDMPKNDYDFKKNLKYDEGELKYTNKGETAKVGVSVSKKQGKIDFDKVKKAGIDFAMIKVGGRGYSKGEITLDDKFVEYANGFKGAGIPIGSYFSSMAITDVEAVEEANYAVAACLNYGLKYPIAIQLDNVKNDDYRTKKLTNKEMTTVVKTFCDTVKNYGFTPIIMADRNFLLSKLNLLDLKDYDFWLIDDEKTDYPYDFSLWNYSDKGNINGIDGECDLNMSFVDYEAR